MKTKKYASFMLMMILLIMTSSVAYNESTLLYCVDDVGTYYHTDPLCKIENSRYLPMDSFTRDMRDHNLYYSFLRPCVVCAADESEKFYKKAVEQYDSFQITEMHDFDNLSIRLMDRDDFTFEDWADVFPDRYAVPKETDISMDEAIRIARDAVEMATGFRVDDVDEPDVDVKCLRGFSMEMPENRDYMVSFYQGVYSTYVVQLSATTGKVWQISNNGDIDTPLGLVVDNVGGYF